MITTVLAVFDVSPKVQSGDSEEQVFEFVLWSKGLNAQITPLPEKQTVPSSAALDRPFWEKFISEHQVSHLLLLTPTDYVVQERKLQAALSGLCSFTLLPKALAVAYGCNQGQLLVLLSKGQHFFDVVPVIDYQVQTAYAQTAAKEDLLRTVWECALQAGTDHPARSALLLENIVLLGEEDAEALKEDLKAKLEKRLPVTAFAGDVQPKKISFRGTPEYHGPIPTDMISFFGALIAARAIFSTDSLYQK